MEKHFALRTPNCSYRVPPELQGCFPSHSLYTGLAGQQGKCWLLLFHWEISPFYITEINPQSWREMSSSSKKITLKSRSTLQKQILISPLRHWDSHFEKPCFATSSYLRKGRTGMSWGVVERRGGMWWQQCVGHQGTLRKCSQTMWQQGLGSRRLSA